MTYEWGMTYETKETREWAVRQAVHLIMLCLWQITLSDAETS